MSKEIMKPTGDITTMSYNQLLTDYSPTKCLVWYRKKHTVALAMNSDAPKLSVLSKRFGEGQLMGYLKHWLLDLNVSLQLKSGLKANQIDQIAFAIMDTYRSLNLAEINLIFKNAKYGEYGDILRISIPTVMRWFKQYYEERLTAAYEQSYSQSVQHKSAFASAPRSMETRKQAGRELKKALDFQQKQHELHEAQKRVDQAKEQLKSKP